MAKTIDVKFPTLSRPDASRDVFVTREQSARVIVVRAGESWTRYLSLPRGARRELRSLLDNWLAPVTGQSAYSPTGRAYWSEPVLIRRPRVVVVAQSGGLDV